MSPESPEPEKSKTVQDDDILSDSSDNFNKDEIGIISNAKKCVLRTFYCPVCKLKFGGKKLFESHPCKTTDLVCEECKKEFQTAKGEKKC